MYGLSRICDLNTWGYGRLRHLRSGVIFAQASCLHSQNNPQSSSRAPYLFCGYEKHHWNVETLGQLL